MILLPPHWEHNPADTSLKVLVDCLLSLPQKLEDLGDLRGFTQAISLRISMGRSPI